MAVITVAALIAGSGVAVAKKKPGATAKPVIVALSVGSAGFDSTLLVVGGKLVLVRPDDGAVFVIAPSARKAKPVGLLGALTNAPAIADLGGTPWIIAPVAPAERAAKLTRVDAKHMKLTPSVDVTTQEGAQYLAGAGGKLWFPQAANSSPDCGAINPGGPVNCITFATGVLDVLQPGHQPVSTGIELGRAITGNDVNGGSYAVFGGANSVFTFFVDPGGRAHTVTQVTPKTGKVLASKPGTFDGINRSIVVPEGLWYQTGTVAAPSLTLIAKQTLASRTFLIDVHSVDPHLAIAGKFAFIALADKVGEVQQYDTKSGKLLGCYQGFPYVDRFTAGGGYLWATSVADLLRTPIVAKPPPCT